MAFCCCTRGMIHDVCRVECGVWLALPWFVEYLDGRESDDVIFFSIAKTEAHHEIRISRSNICTMGKTYDVLRCLPSNPVSGWHASRALLTARQCCSQTVCCLWQHSLCSPLQSSLIFNTVNRGAPTQLESYGILAPIKTSCDRSQKSLRCAGTQCGQANHVTPQKQAHEAGLCDRTTRLV
jgi:hypothetical protein